MVLLWVNFRKDTSRSDSAGAQAVIWARMDIRGGNDDRIKYQELQHSYADHCARIGEALRRSIERCWFQAIWREELVRPTFSAHCGGGPEEKTLGSKGAGIREFQKSSSHLCSSRERTGWKGGAGLCSATMGGSRVFGLAAGGPKVVRWRCGARKLLKTGQW